MPALLGRLGEYCSDAPEHRGAIQNRAQGAKQGVLDLRNHSHVEEDDND